MVSKLTFDVLVNFPLENETSTKCIMIICWDGDLEKQSVGCSIFVSSGRKQFRLFVKFYLNSFPSSSCCFIELILYCNMMSHNVSFQIDQYCVFLSLGLWKLKLYSVNCLSLK